MTVASMCDALHILLGNLSTPTIDYKVIDSWISSIYEKSSYTNAEAERGCRIVVDSPAKIATVAKKTVWLGGGRRCRSYSGMCISLSFRKEEINRESHMRFPTDMKLLWESFEWLYRHIRKHCGELGIRRPRNKYNDFAESYLSYCKKRKKKALRVRVDPLHLNKPCMHQLQEFLSYHGYL